MVTRRLLLAAVPAIMAAPARATPDSFQVFLNGLKAEARHAGISQSTLDKALAGFAPNQKVLDRDRHQPEFQAQSDEAWTRTLAFIDAHSGV